MTKKTTRINNEQNTAQNDSLNTITTIKTATSENDDSVNKINKRRRTGDDLLDAFLEISDIMTYNQMQPTAQDSNALVNNEIEMIDNVNTVHDNIHS